MDGVSDPVLQQQLTVVYAIEAYLTDPPTVESLWFSVQKLQRRRHQQQPRDPGCTESVPYQSLQSERIPRAKMARQYDLPTHLARRLAQIPAPSVHTTPVCKQAATSSQRARCLESDCSGRKLVVHSAEVPHMHDPDRKPQQVNATKISAPAAPEK